MIIHRSGKQSSTVNALSCNPCGSASTEEIGESELQIATVSDDAIHNEVNDISVLLQLEPNSNDVSTELLALEQKKDHSLTDLLTYLKVGTLPREEHQACKVVAQASLFGIEDGCVVQPGSQAEITEMCCSSR